jgi:hypothetical protein
MQVAAQAPAVDTWAMTRVVRATAVETRVAAQGRAEVVRLETVAEMMA